MNNGESCPSLIIQEVPPTDLTGVYIALAIGLAVLALLAAIIAYVLKNSKSTDSLLLDGIDPFSQSGTTASPIYQQQTEIHSSGIFQSNTTGDTDL